MKSPQYSLLILFLISLTSCINEINVDFSQPEKQIVLNSFISPDTNVFVNLSYTKTVNTCEDYYIPDAEVKLYWEDSSAILNYVDSGLYTCYIKPRINVKYKIEVIKNDTVLTAETYIPDTNFFNSINIDLMTGYNADMAMPSHDANITIIDDPNQRNYYEIFFPERELYDSAMYYQTVQYAYLYGLNAPLCAIYDSCLIKEGYNPAESYQRILFSDENFNTDTVTLHLHPSCYVATPYHNDTLIYYGNITVIVRNVSEDYYKHQKSYDLYKANLDDNGFTSFANMSYISKILNVYNNVQGGYGIFAGYSQICRKIYVEEKHIN